MLNYILRRLLLLPITLFCIILVNFVIINLAPGDPVTITEISQEGGGAVRKEDRSVAFGSDERYLQFREYFGLTLPILFNTWPWTTQKSVDQTLRRLETRKYAPSDLEEMNFKSYEDMRIAFGDRARFIMQKLLDIIRDPHADMSLRSMASRFFARGGTRQAYLGPNLDEQQKLYNVKIAKDNNLLSQLIIQKSDSPEEVTQKVSQMQQWYEENKAVYQFDPTPAQKIKSFFFDTRFFRYMKRVLSFDFGTLRNDQNKTVVSEVAKRFKYSLTLSITPMFFTFALCLIFGALMAYFQNRWPDYVPNVFFLILYAIPIFVVAPFLIEEVALNRTFPFTNIPIPISGFTSPDSIYNNLNSFQRFTDILKHIFLPLIAIMYGSLAAQARLSRTAMLEVLRQDFVRTAKAKGTPPLTILWRDVGRNASITIVTSLASSLGIVLGGSLIVETLFEINGFGKFFYDAILNRDYNVIMFSALAGSFLTLIGYLVADLAYTLLDPRLTLE
jgi:peptide/nickel transport system permease protein